MYQNKLLVIVSSLLIFVAVVAIVGWGYFFASRPPVIPQYSNERSVFSVLISDNEAFKEADALMRARDFPSARTKYEEALSSAGDSTQKAYITYWIASTDEMLGDYALAVREFKEVAGTPISYNLLRAYAVMRIGLLYDLYGYGEHRDVIVAETFKEEPYSSFLVEADEPLAYRRLYEYASSLYPTAISELHIADWHADGIWSLQRSGAKTEEYFPYTAVVLEKIESAKRDIERSLGDQNASGFTPFALVLMGEVLAKLTLASQLVSGSSLNEEAARNKGITLEVAEDAYLKALEQRALQGGTDGYERFHYASFLDRYIPERKEDIRTTLSNFYGTSAYKNAPIMKFFAGQRGTETWMSGSLSRMASIDPEFKTLLISLGWSEADFK